MARSALRLLALALAASPLAAAVQLAGPVPCDRGAPLPPCNVWASREPLGPANEVHIALDPADPQHLLVVAKDYALGAAAGCSPQGGSSVAAGAYATFDGGATWTAARIPAPYPNGGALPSPLPFRCVSDPVAAFGPGGVAYVAVLNFAYDGAVPQGGAVAVARSPDGGRTWPGAEVRVVHASPGDDKEWLAVDRAGRAHLAWVDFDAGRIWYARSDAAFAFGAPQAVARAGSGNPGVVAATGPEDQVYLLWRDGAELRMARSLDGGGGFEAPWTAMTVRPYETGGPPRFPFLPQLAVDLGPTSPHRGRLYAVWPEAGAAATDADVALASSDDGGRTWSGPTRVDDFTLLARRQVLPAVSVAPDGRVDVAWLDQRLDLTTPHDPTGVLDGQALETFHAYAASSRDGGASWSENRMVSELPLVARLSRHQSGVPFVGDYMGVASAPDAAWPAFPGDGADRLLEGLAPLHATRVDAYVARVPAGAAPQRAPLSFADGPWPPGDRLSGPLR
jgi:hypothetical protein